MTVCVMDAREREREGWREGKSTEGRSSNERSAVQHTGQEPSVAEGLARAGVGLRKERTAGAFVHRPRGHHRSEVGLALDAARSIDDVCQRDRQRRQPAFNDLGALGDRLQKRIGKCSTW